MWFCQMCVWLGGSWDAVAGWPWPPTIPLGHVGGWEPWRRVIFCFMVLRVKPRSTGKMIFSWCFRFMACADHHDIELSMREFLDAPCIKELRRSSCAAWLQEVFFQLWVVVWLRTTLGSFCQVTDMQLTRWWGKLVCFTGTQGRLRVGALLRSLGRTLSAMSNQSGVPEIDRPQTTDTFFDLFLHCPIFPESVWAQGSSNSGGLYLIFSSSHLLIFTSAHLHICSSSHRLIFTSAHLHIVSSSHLLIFTSAHLHICSSSHLLIFTSSHLHICSSSHLLIFTSAHLHICSSSHLLIFTSSHLHICSSSHLLIFTSAHLHICSSSHLLIFTSSHLHICSSSHLLIFTSAHLHIFTYSHLLSLSLSPLSSLLSLSPFSLPFLSLAFFIFLSLSRGWCRRGVTKRQPFRTKWGSIVKNWKKLRFYLSRSNPFARNEGRSSKT